MTEPSPKTSFARLRSCALAVVHLPQIFVADEMDRTILGDEVAASLLMSAARQLTEGRGETEDDPLTDLGVEGFYLLASAIELEILGQSARAEGGGRMLDRMDVRTEDMEGVFDAVVYNLVKR
jgi:hypothetical protein